MVDPETEFAVGAGALTAVGDDGDAGDDRTVLLAGVSAGVLLGMAEAGALAAWTDAGVGERLVERWSELHPPIRTIMPATALATIGLELRLRRIC
jgi:hypothetical protein